MAKLDAEGRIWYPTNDDGTLDTTRRPKVLRFLDEVGRPVVPNIWDDIQPLRPWMKYKPWRHTIGAPGGQYISDETAATLRASLQDTIDQFGFDPATAKALKAKFGFIHEYSLRRRIKSLVRTLDPTWNPIKSEGAFVSKVVDTRNYLTHFTAELAEKRATGAELRRITHYLDIILKVCLLRELGFSAELIHRLLTR